jgi:hypothetical protein
MSRWVKRMRMPCEEGEQGVPAAAGVMSNAVHLCGVHLHSLYASPKVDFVLTCL